jgi:hypothetical protein
MKFWFTVLPDLGQYNTYRNFGTSLHDVISLTKIWTIFFLNFLECECVCVCGCVCEGGDLLGFLGCVNMNKSKIIPISNLKLLPTSTLWFGIFLVNVCISWQNRRNFPKWNTKCNRKHKTDDASFLCADRDSTLMWPHHVYLEGPDLLIWQTDTECGRPSSGSLYQTAKTGVKTEITIEWMTVCKWQHSFTFRSVQQTITYRSNITKKRHIYHIMTYILSNFFCKFIKPHFGIVCYRAT